MESPRKKRRPLSPETKAKISAARKGQRISEEAKAKMSAKLRGRTREHTVSAETRAKLREAGLRRATNGYSPGGWNKGLTKSSDPRVAENAKAVSRTVQRKLQEGTFEKGSLSEDGRKRISQAAKLRKSGGHISKQAIWYTCVDGTEVYLHSSFELRVASELDANRIPWVRPEPLNWTDAKDEAHRYYPDFFLPTFGVYLDPKNPFLMKKDALKIAEVQKQNGVVVLVLSEQELTWDRILSKILPLKHLGDAAAL